MLDVIFLIYLYQRWIYPVDYKRVNEFGQGGEDRPFEDVDSTSTTTQDSSKSLESKKRD